MTPPNYTWYLWTERNIDVDYDAGTARQLVKLVPVRSNGFVGAPLWYATPAIPGAVGSGGDLQLPAVGGAPSRFVAGPAFVGPDGSFYGIAAKRDRGEQWDAGVAYPLRVWRNTPALTVAASVVEDVALLSLPTVAPDPSATQLERVQWYNRLFWRDGVVCVVDHTYSQLTPGGWLPVVGTDTVREGGSTRWGLSDDTRPGGGSNPPLAYGGATVQFADGRSASAQAERFNPS